MVLMSQMLEQVSSSGVWVFFLERYRKFRMSLEEKLSLLRALQMRWHTICNSE